MRLTPFLFLHSQIPFRFQIQNPKKSDLDHETEPQQLGFGFQKRQPPTKLSD